MTPTIIKRPAVTQPYCYHTILHSHLNFNRKHTRGKSSKSQPWHISKRPAWHAPNIAPHNLAYHPGLPGAYSNRVNSLRK